MISSVAKFGVMAIDPQGQAFDPNQHQAMSMIENADVAANTVIAVMQKGYDRITSYNVCYTKLLRVI